jgi:hypothetical protein
MSGIRHTAMSQSVRQKQVAELVMDGGFGDGQDGQKRCA